MLPQIIFFLAVGLFLFLFERRYRFTTALVERFRHGAKQLLDSTSQLGSSGAKIISSQAKRVGQYRPNLSPFQSDKISQQPSIFEPSVNTSSAVDFWQEDMADGKPELSSHFEEGDRLFREGKYKEAETFFIKAAAQHPDDPKVYARLGLLYLNNKTYTDAVEALKIAVKLDKYNPSRHYNLALAYWGNKDSQRAIMSIREAISLDPVTPKYRQFLEQLLNKK